MVDKIGTDAGEDLIGGAENDLLDGKGGTTGFTARMAMTSFMAGVGMTCSTA